ncbi:hypothetical protein M2323_003295 [Rhodoblastus acidophilus]|nr:hypothetical protein [Rhodoblastus acidophilus]
MAQKVEDSDFDEKGRRMSDFALQNGRLGGFRRLSARFGGLRRCGIDICAGRKGAARTGCGSRLEAISRLFNLGCYSFFASIGVRSDQINVTR